MNKLTIRLNDFFISYIYIFIYTFMDSLRDVHFIVIQLNNREVIKSKPKQSSIN